MKDNLIDSIGRNFERLLRWAYPGALFLVLLRLARPNDFEKLANVLDDRSLWGLFVGGLVAGTVVYLAQGYVMNQLVSLVLAVVRWDVNIRPFDHPRRLQQFLHWWFVGWVVPRLTCLADSVAQNAQRRWTARDYPRRLSSWLDYAWGVHHAMSSTGWLVLFFFLFWKEPGSRFARAPQWEILVPSIGLLLGSLWFHAVLVRIPLKGNGCHEHVEKSRGNRQDAAGG